MPLNRKATICSGNWKRQSCGFNSKETQTPWFWGQNPTKWHSEVSSPRVSRWRCYVGSTWIWLSLTGMFRRNEHYDLNHSSVLLSVDIMLNLVVKSVSLNAFWVLKPLLVNDLENVFLRQISPCVCVCAYESEHEKYMYHLHLSHLTWLILAVYPTGCKMCTNVRFSDVNIQLYL